MDDNNNSDEIIGGVKKQKQKLIRGLEAARAAKDKNENDWSKAINLAGQTASLENADETARFKKQTKDLQNIKDKNENDWSKAINLAGQTASLENADETAELKKRRKNEEKAMKTEERIIEEAEETTDIFDELPVVFIGMYSFEKDELVNQFGDKNTNKDKVVSLLKRVFQKKYPITRRHGLPKIPSKKSDKDLLIKLMQNYFQRLRFKIIKERKNHGNSMDLRQKIDQLQQIKILEDHFINDKETFPYHDFKNYIDNEDAIDYNEDLVEQIKKLKFKKNENNRIRNLLRQFVKLYLLQRNNETFTLSDPGESKERFKIFMKQYKKNKPQIIVDLIDLLEGKAQQIALENNVPVNYDGLYDVLTKLSDEFYTIQSTESDNEEAVGNRFPTSGGGKIAVSRDVDPNKSVNSFVRKIFDEYKELKAIHKDNIIKHASELSAKDEKHAEELRKLTKEKEAIAANATSLTEDISKYSSIINSKDEEITKLTASIKTLTSDLTTKSEAETALSSQIAELKLSTNSQAKQEAATLLGKQEELKTQLRGIRAELAELKLLKINLEGSNKTLKAEKTAAEEQLRVATARIADLESQLESTIPRANHNANIAAKDAEIAGLRADIANKPSAEQLSTLERQLSEKNAEIEALHLELVGAESRLNATVANLVTQLQKQAASTTGNNEPLIQLQTQLSQLQERNTELTESLRVCKETNTRLEAKEAEFDNLQSTKASDIEALSAAHAAELAETAAALSKAQADHTSALGSHAALTTERDELLGSVAESSRNVASLEIENAELKTKITELTDLANQWKAAHDKLETVTSSDDQTFTSVTNYGNKWKEAYERLQEKCKQEETPELEEEAKGEEVAKKKITEQNVVTQWESAKGRRLTEQNVVTQWESAKGRRLTEEGKTARLEKEEALRREKEAKATAKVLKQWNGTRGGSTNDPLYKYVIQVADDRLDDFLLETPLPFFELIQSFDKSIIRETNESYLLQLFVIHQLEEHFDCEEMKDFFTQFQFTFEKTDFSELCVVLFEICNTIRKTSKDVDVVRLETTTYNGEFDGLEEKLRENKFDFYEAASKQLLELKSIDIKYHEGHIYFKPNTNSFEHTYTMDSSMNLEKTEYDFNEELYTVNNKVLYFFFILSAYNTVKSEIKDSQIVDALLKHTRTTKRNQKKSAKKVMAERLDGQRS